MHFSIIRQKGFLIVAGRRVEGKGNILADHLELTDGSKKISRKGRMMIKKGPQVGDWVEVRKNNIILILKLTVYGEECKGTVLSFGNGISPKGEIDFPRGQIVGYATLEEAGKYEEMYNAMKPGSVNCPLDKDVETVFSASC